MPGQRAGSEALLGRQRAPGLEQCLVSSNNVSFPSHPAVQIGLLNEAVRNTILGLLFQACLNGGDFAFAFKGCLLVDIHLLPPLHRTPPDLF